MIKYYISEDSKSKFIYSIAFIPVAIFFIINYLLWRVPYGLYSIFLVLFLSILAYDIYRQSKSICVIVIDDDKIMIETYGNKLFNSRKIALERSGLEIINNSGMDDVNSGIIIRDKVIKDNFYINKNTTITNSNLEEVSHNMLINKLRN